MSYPRSGMSRLRSCSKSLKADAPTSPGRSFLTTSNKQPSWEPFLPRCTSGMWQSLTYMHGHFRRYAELTDVFQIVPSSCAATTVPRSSSHGSMVCSRPMKNTSRGTANLSSPRTCSSCLRSRRMKTSKFAPRGKKRQSKRAYKSVFFVG